MPLSLDQIKEELYPGLAGVIGSYAEIKERWAATIFNEWELATPHIWVPKPAELILAAAALAIVKNPVVSRRFWSGWFGAEHAPDKGTAC